MTARPSPRESVTSVRRLRPVDNAAVLGTRAAADLAAAQAGNIPDAMHAPAPGLLPRRSDVPVLGDAEDFAFRTGEVATEKAWRMVQGGGLVGSDGEAGYQLLESYVQQKGE